MLHEFVAPQVIVPEHALVTPQTTVQSLPPQVIAPQLLDAAQATEQLLAEEQSTPPAQASAPVQSTKHGSPDGQFTELQGFAVLQ
jgi:hypothetical protein